jgi:hypothetical protein
VRCNPLPERRIAFALAQEAILSAHHVAIGAANELVAQTEPTSVEASVIQHHVERSALAGYAPELDQGRARKAAIALERFATETDRSGLRAVRTSLRSAVRIHAMELLAPMSPAWLERNEGRCMPVLRRPDVVHKRLFGLASRTCVSLLPFELTRQAKRILARSDLRKDAPRYETFELRGQLCVRGVDGQRVLHLAAIAHELGHCIQEERAGGHSLPALIASESAAQIVEHLVVARWLTHAAGEDAVRQWNEYQRRVDVLSVVLCELDIADALGEPAPEVPFERGFCFVRRSFASAPGTESVFAAACIQRTRVLRALGPHALIEQALELSTRTALDLLA